MAHTNEDVLNGTTQIFLNEIFKINLDKVLLEKQKKKKEALDIIQRLYLSFKKKRSIRLYFEQTGRCVAISRDLIKSWTAKLEGMKFRNYQKTVRTIQRRIRNIKYKRQKRLQAYNMQLVTKYLGLYKFTKLSLYILHYKRKIQVMQAMVDRKVKDSKNRYIKSIVEKIFTVSWDNIKREMELKSISDIQRTYRSYLLRKKKTKEFNQLKKKIKDSIVQNAAITLQRHVKGYLVRSRLERLTRSVMLIQGFFRMKWMRIYFRRILKSVSILQRFFRKYYIRKKKINEQMAKFLEVYETYNQSVADLEHDILFSDKDNFSDLNNINDYTKLPFYLQNKEIDFGKSNYKRFVPKAPEIELKPKAKLFSILIDIDVKVDTTNIYYNTWAKEFVSFIKETHSRSARFIQLEVGESFCLAVTDDKQVYTWGLNDFKQCCQQGNVFSTSMSQIQSLSDANPKMVSIGKDHGIMLDDGQNVFVWGRNNEGQLGLGHCRKSGSIFYLNMIKEEVRQIKAIENRNFLLTKKGEVLTWPAYEKGESIFKPTEMSMPFHQKIVNMDFGSDFGMFLGANGLLFAQGENEFGQLGLGDFISREKLCLVKNLKNKNEKIVEVSCGYKHVICRSTLCKVFTWGLNRDYQLGLGDSKDRTLPQKLAIPSQKKLRFKPTSVQGSLTSSFVLLDDRQLFYTGKVGA